MSNNLTESETEVLNQLRKHAESRELFNGAEWGSVYLDNCQMSGSKQFSGLLASLTKKGFYMPEDGEYKSLFGMVKLED